MFAHASLYMELGHANLTDDLASLDGTQTEIAKLKLWKTLDSDVRTMNLTVVVDNSVVEVHANDEAIITTRA